MNRIEVRLSLPVVAPLLDVIKEVADSLNDRLAAPLEMGEVDEDMRDVWRDELVAGQNGDVARLLALFGSEFIASGIVAFDEENAEPVARACTAVRLRLREHSFKDLTDEMLEGGEIEIEKLDEPVRKSFMCYLFLATLLELIIQYMDTPGEETDDGGNFKI